MINITFVGTDEQGETFQWVEVWDHAPRVSDHIAFMSRMVYYTPNSIDDKGKYRAIQAKVTSVTWASKFDAIVRIE